MIEKLGVIGTGGHAKVIVDIGIRKNPEQWFSFFTSNIAKARITHPFLAYSIYPDSPSEISQRMKGISFWHVAIGDPFIRQEKVDSIEKLGGLLHSMIHDQCTIATQTRIGSGTSVMAGVVLNPYVRIGKGCIINTASSIDHDCQIDDFVNIGPGVRVAGGVQIGKLTELGTGAIVIPNISIGASCIIGAGAVVTQNIPDYCVAVGVPAKVIRQNK